VQARLRALDVDLPVVTMTVQGDVATAVRAQRRLGEGTTMNVAAPTLRAHRDQRS
jgi:FixJ family two-component response regulator